MMNPQRRMYGTWDSPLTPGLVAATAEFGDVAWDHQGALIWLRKQDGRGTLFVQDSEGGAPRSLAADLAVGAGVGYGGGDFAAADGRVVFVARASGRLYVQPLREGLPHPITPPFGAAASPAVSPDGRWCLYVHSLEGQDALGLAATQGEGWPHKWVSGDDFYMQPCWHPTGEHVAWVAWNHPQMPWDGTWLRVGSLIVDGEHPPGLADVVTVAGGEAVAAIQPEFSPDGRYLAYLADETGWWQLYLYDLTRGQTRQLTHVAAEHGGPAWLQGQRYYAFSPDGGRIYFLRNEGGFASLWRLEVQSGAEERLALDPAYTWLAQPAIIPAGDQLALLASGPATPQRVITLDLVSGQVTVRARSAPEVVPQTTFSRPRPLTWPAEDGMPVYGLFFPPTSPRFESAGRPPLIVHVHGGPTSQVTAAYEPQFQFFTSRGYAVLAVNYRGSSGYGRAYRETLKGHWGQHDVADVVRGAQYLVAEELVDGQRLAIMGGSAGGYTVLLTLIEHPAMFKASICRYGVADLLDLAAATHKFEAHYLDSLVGPLPEAAPLYRARSPLPRAARIQDPLALFHGEDDRAVPIAHSEAIVAALRRRGVPHVYHRFAGEGHGFRKVETIRAYYTAVDQFLRKYVVFA